RALRSFPTRRSSDLAHGADRALRPDRARESTALANAVGQRELVDLALSLDRWRRDVIESNVNARMLLELLVLRLPYAAAFAGARSEEHTSELQSRFD